MNSDYVELNLKLQIDGSVDFSQIVRGRANRTYACENCVVTIPVKVRDEELLYPESIVVTDLNTKFADFVKVGRLNPPDCIGQFEFDYTSNDMEICINNTIPNEVAYQVEYTYEPYNPMKELCDDLGIVARPVSFEFSRDRFPDTLRVSMSLGDGFSDFVKLESCFLNKTPLRTGKEFVCVLTKEDVLKSTPDKEIIQLNITLRGELEEKAQRTEETRERVLQTAKVVLGIMIGTVCFFGVLRTRIKNKVYATFRNDNLRDQILLFLVALAVIIAYCYLLIWWRGWPFVR